MLSYHFELPLSIILPLVYRYKLDASPVLMCMRVVSVTMQRASFETVRYAFAILMFINLYTLVILFLYFSFSIALNHTGARCIRRGNMPPTYIVFSALWPSPQLIFADFA